MVRRHLLVTPRDFSRLRYELISAQSCRFLTTPVTDPTSKPTGPHLSHPHPAPQRKPKIELRPGPLKATSANQTAATTIPASAPADVEKGANAASDPIPQPGVVESAKIDYGEAARHGILAPPPADASKIGRLWHQAKEYFVRSNTPITRQPGLNPVS